MNRASPLKKRFKIILTQLPFRFYNLELTKQISNIPLAAGLLKAMAYKEGLIKDADIEILTPLTADVTSDSMLLETLINKKPDLIGFSLYLWNLTRSLYLIKEIKRCLPGTIILVGGPEITEEFNYISGQGADFAVKGEGEIPFIQLVKHLLGSKPGLDSISNLIFKKEDRIICNPYLDIINDINEIPSPYLSGCLDPRSYKLYWLETMRWCAYKCKYCLYRYRSQMKNPFYSLERIAEELNYAKRLGIDFIDIHDSAFNLNPRFREICGIIQKINKNKSFRLKVFLQAERLNEEDVELLASLNISSIEIGLQTANPKILRAIGRDINLEEWLRGINLLRRKRMNIAVDIMIGLPGDDLRSISRTIEFLRKNKLDTYALPPMLSVGVAIALRKEARKIGVVRFQSQAPYFILTTRRMSFADIRKAKSLTTMRLRNRLPLDSIFSPYHDTRLPYLHTYCWPKYPYRLKERLDADSVKEYPQGIPITKVIIDVNSKSQDAGYFKKLGMRISNKIANNLIVWFRIIHPAGVPLKGIQEFLKYLSEPNPYNIWNIVFEGCPPFSFREERTIKQSISYLPNNLDYRKVYMRRRLGKKEFYRVSTKLFYILPLLNTSSQKEAIPKVNENRKIFRNLHIGNTLDLPNLIKSLRIKNNEGLLVDFDMEVKPETIIDALGMLKSRVDKRNCFRFRNLMLQRLWFKFFNNYAIREIINDDLILYVDADKAERFYYLSHKKIMLDMTEFILSSKKNLSCK